MQPDREASRSDQAEDLVPTRGYRMTPVVGLGGAGGALPALRQFFRHLPPAPGIACVVVVDDGDHQAIAAELDESSSLKVVSVQDSHRIEPDHVYVIPNGSVVHSVDGRLVVGSVDTSTPVSVDLFFRVLADTRGPHSAAIVLSGSHADGAIGIKRIKERGGITLAQDPDEAEQSGMPRAAIGTGMVD
ncbi:MAG TPA: chemotaxis protein CheB, partial [Ramlibacter sp.]